MKNIFFALISMLLVQQPSAQKSITLVESTAKISGNSYSEHYFGFVEGDKIIVDLKVVKGKKLGEVEVIELHNNIRYQTSK